ncbi:MAG: TPM domain-containing protein [Bacteroidota bacterium]|jgi:uncharacterized protein
MEQIKNVFNTRMTELMEIILVSVITCTFSFSQPDVPSIKDPVTDLTNTLSPEQYQLLRSQILQFEDSTSNQLVLVMIPTLDGGEIRDYGIQVLEQNKIGQKGKDNGILLLVVKDDRKVSIEVGYGLEGVLTDAVCNQIIRNEILPQFRDGNYYEGVSSAVASIVLVTKGEYAADRKSKRKQSDWFSVIITFIIIISFISFFGRGRRQSLSSRGANAIWWGGGLGGGGSNWNSFGGGGGGGGWSAGGGSFGGGGSSGSW